MGLPRRIWVYPEEYGFTPEEYGFTPEEFSERWFFFVYTPQAAQAYYVWIRASEVIWSEYTSMISVLSDTK